MNNQKKLVEVNGLTKKFGSITAVDQISFDVMEGEIFGFLGPNGAGKTTLIRMLVTLVKPSGGNAQVAGFDIMRDSDKVRNMIGVVPQAMTTDLDLTGIENMDIYGRFYAIPLQERKKRIQELIETVGLKSRAKDLVATYSGGMRRRLEIARALMHTPKLLILDEPTIGLDPQSRRMIWDFLNKLIEARSMTIFITTHYMEEAEALCTRVAIIDSGKIIAIGTPEMLKSEIPGNDIIHLTIENLSQDVMDKIKAIPFIHNTEIAGQELRIHVDNGAQCLISLLDTLRASEVKILSVTVHEQSLEDVFIHYTGKSIREKEARKFSFLIGAGAPQKWGK